MKTLIQGFTYARRGIWYCLRHERHFRIHLTVAAYVLAFAPSFSLSRAEWAALILTIALVIAAEAFNSTVEYTINLISPSRHPLAAIAKDAAAGGVLICAAASVAVGVALFGDATKLAALWRSLTAAPWTLVLLGLSLLLSLWFIFCAGAKDEVTEVYKERMDSSPRG